MLNIKNRMKNLFDWYSRLDVQYNIIKYTKNREVAFLIPSYETKQMKCRSTRMLKIHSTQHLSFICDSLNMFSRQTPYNFYVSLAEFQNGIPNQDLSNNMKNRDNKEFYANYWKEIKYYDLVIDIDAKRHDNILFARDTTLIIGNLLKSFSVKFELRFSGRGFHFYIPVNIKTLSLNPNDEINLYYKMNFILKMLNKLYSEMVDISFLYIPFSVIKIPFTVANYQDSQYICLPFDFDNLVNFDLKFFDLSNHISKFYAEYNFKNFTREFINRDLNASNFLLFYDFIFKKFNDNFLKTK